VIHGTAVEQTEDAAAAFARTAATIAFEDLPPATVLAAKRSVLDTLGVTLAATGTAPDLATFAAYAIEQGGRPESTILGFGGRVPAPAAAFVNGAAAHALDFDDVHDTITTHPSAPLVSATMALAERIGGVSGRDLLTAVAVGQDLFLRLTAAADFWKHGVMGPCALGGLATALASSRILGLDRYETYNAIGIAACQTGAPGQLAVNVGSNLRSFYAAFPAHAGTVAALLAQQGIGGIVEVFEGELGVFKTLFDGEYDRERLVGGLGSDFAAEGISYKAYPACRLSHVYIDAILEILDEGVQPAEIASVTLRVGQQSGRLCQPDEARRRPTTVMDAKFSIPFIVGLALARRRLSLSDFSVDSLTDPAVLAQTDKVSYVYDSSLDLDDPLVIPPGVVEVTTVSEGIIVKRIDVPYGNPHRPMSTERLHAKFAGCAALAAFPVPTASVDQAIDLLDSLETCADVSALPRLLSPS
jgi:2-methylcitrate dehydratase PrpD